MAHRFQFSDKHEIANESKKWEPYEKEYYDHLSDQFFERHWEISELYPHNFRASFLIHIISFIEYELKKICDYYHETSKTDFSISDLKGNSEIEKAKIYLTNVCKVDFSKLNPEWNFINTCKLIRNKLIHQQGILNETDKELNKFIQKTTFIKIREPVSQVKMYNLSNQIIIHSKDLNNQLLKSTEDFFEKLIVTELKFVKF